MLATYTCNQTPAEVDARKEAFLARNLFKEAPAYTKETDANGDEWVSPLIHEVRRT